MNPSFNTIGYGSDEHQQSMQLRDQIFKSKGGPEELNYIHVVGLLDKVVCATAALVPEEKVLKMQKVGVKVDLQRQKIGSLLVGFCHEYAKKHDFTSIYCYSRMETIPFYLKNGFKIEGDVSYKDGVPHQKMRIIIE